MFGFLNKFRSKAPQKMPPPPVDIIAASLTRGICPDCKGDQFYMGPQGGACQNIQCAFCGSKFTVGPFEDGHWLGDPMIAQRSDEVN